MEVKNFNQLDRKRRVVLRKVFVCNVIGCTGWAKLTGKVQLPVVEVIFQ